MCACVSVFVLFVKVFLCVWLYGCVINDVKEFQMRAFGWKGRCWFYPKIQFWSCSHCPLMGASISRERNKKINSNITKTDLRDIRLWMRVISDDYEREDVNLQDTDRVRLGVWPPTHETCGTTNLDEIKLRACSLAFTQLWWWWMMQSCFETAVALSMPCIFNENLLMSDLWWGVRRDNRTNQQKT